MTSMVSVIPSAKHTHAHGHVTERVWLSRLWKARETRWRSEPAGPEAGD